MAWRYRACGFPLCAGYRFRYRGRSFRVTRHDVRSIKVLVALFESRPRGEVDPYWLVSHRADLRRILAHVSPATLALITRRSRVLPFRRFAIWLLGRTGGKLGTSSLSDAALTDHVVLRREAVRALKRKQAWSALREISQCDPDERVRVLARQTRPHDYVERLAGYLGDVAPRAVPQTRPALIVATDLRSRPGRPPKSPYFIRYVLERIRWLVHGSHARSPKRAK
jgi:hypothetical protein